jgi:2,4-dienoyl-CoA reductase-like NADH-dependent reductase (Old Yellow Enzyme family)
MSKLFEPLQMGDLRLRHRVVMAPLTRCRASEGRVPNALMREYYEQRSGAGMILSEATAVTPQGVGYVDTPGLWSREQVEGWKAITQAVHERGGLIVAQLWHVGRLSHPDFLGGELPVAPSAIAPQGQLRVPTGHKPYVTPRELGTEEVRELVEVYRQGALNAKEAGFDGVEIHGANGYLPDQFLRDGANKRTDEYGGPIENRARFLLEVTDAAISVWGAGRVGVHLSPRALEHHSIEDSDPAATFGYVSRELGRRGVAFLGVRESVEGDGRYGPEMKRLFQEAGGGAYIANESFSREEAERAIEAGEADAVAWGQLFIANPDLPRRFELDAPLNAPDPSTFYAQGATGYTDQPFLDGEHASQPRVAAGSLA